jgi:hypothetical protein
MRHVPVAHRRQFTGSVFAGVSMRIRAVVNNLSILFGQHLWSEFLDPFRRNIQRSGYVRLSVAFRCKRLDYRDSLLLVESGAAYSNCCERIQWDSTQNTYCHALWTSR